MIASSSAFSRSFHSWNGSDILSNMACQYLELVNYQDENAEFYSNLDSNHVFHVVVLVGQFYIALQLYSYHTEPASRDPNFE